MVSPFSPRRRSQSPIGRRRRTVRPEVQPLERRSLLSGYQQINLVGYQPGMAPHTDPNLNGWGMDFAPGGPFCVADTTPGVATFYDRLGPGAPPGRDHPGGAQPAPRAGRPAHGGRLQPDLGFRDLRERQVGPGRVPLRRPRRHDQRLEPRRGPGPCHHHGR